jgi:hypothetical protein
MKRNPQINALAIPIAWLADSDAPLKIQRARAAHSRCVMVISTGLEARRNQPDVCATFGS